MSSTYTNIHENVTNNCNIDNYFLSFEEIMDLLPSTTDNLPLTYKQLDQNIDTVSKEKDEHIIITIHVFFLFSYII